MQLNEGLESIGDRAFQNSGIEEVCFPSSLRRVGKDVFAGCEHLRVIEQKTNYGTLAVAADSALTVHAKHDAEDGSSDATWIKANDAKILQEQTNKSQEQQRKEE